MIGPKNQTFLPKDLLIDSLKLSAGDLVGVEDLIKELRELASLQESIDETAAEIHLTPQEIVDMRKEADELFANFPSVDFADVEQEARELFANLPPKDVADITLPED